MNGFLILAAHALGDFLLQNHWMQRKNQDSCVCATHVLFYSFPFTLLLAATLIRPELNFLQPWQWIAIILQHYLQDRYSLHLKWMQFYGQTPPDKWPVGPLFVDQAMHLTWMGIVYAFSY